MQKCEVIEGTVEERYSCASQENPQQPDPVAAKFSHGLESIPNSKCNVLS